MSTPKKVAVITFSTRTPRVGPKIADLAHAIITNDAEASRDVDITQVAVADFNLPVYDEEVIPAMVPSEASFVKPHSIAWSAEIAKYDAYVLVIPEYNYGIAGGTKNAIDYLCNEWKGKPAVIISYGLSGGRLASAAAKQSLEGIGLRVAQTMPGLVFHRGASSDMADALNKGHLGQDTAEDIQKQAPTILKAFSELKELLGTA